MAQNSFRAARHLSEIMDHDLPASRHEFSSLSSPGATPTKILDLSLSLWITLATGLQRQKKRILPTHPPWPACLPDQFANTTSFTSLMLRSICCCSSHFVYPCVCVCVSSAFGMVGTHDTAWTRHSRTGFGHQSSQADKCVSVWFVCLRLSPSPLLSVRLDWPPG